MPEHSHPVIESDLAQGDATEAAFMQSTKEAWQAARISDRPRHDCALEVGAKGDVVLSYPIYEVAHVLHDRFDRDVFIKVRVRAHITNTEIESNNPARLPYRAKLPVGKVASRAANRVCAGMGSDEWSGGDRCDIPEPALIHVRYIDHNAEPIAGVYQCFSRPVRPGLVSGERG